MTDRSDTPPGQHNTGEDSDGTPSRLQGAQREIARAYFDTDTGGASGLYVLSCVPGAGKSFTETDIAARELLGRWVRGDPTPEQHVAVLTFTRSEAATIGDDLTSRLRTLVEHDLTPAAAAITETEVAPLISRIRRAPYIGTIDGFLRTLLEDFRGAVGFETMPTVGSQPHLEQLHSDCYDTLQATSEYAAPLERLTEAYPAREYAAGVDDLLREALRTCRTHRLDEEEFQARLLATVDGVYPDGPPTSSEDIVAAIARCVGADATEAEVADAVSATDRLIETDQALHEAWTARIDDFCTVLAGYHAAYRTAIRERGVISHLDCAYLVAEALSETDEGEGTTGPLPKRVRNRHRDRIESVLIDEAQDLATIQHDAIAPLVTPDSRVLLAGDLRQSIYAWRDARPALFDRALTDGTYFGIDWTPHVVETATQTYRCRPAIAAAINTLAGRFLPDPERGALGSLDIMYPPLEPVRASAADPAVHIAAVGGHAYPGTDQYRTPSEGQGEAGMLAAYIARGLADGTLTAADTPPDTGDSSPRDTVGPETPATEPTDTAGSGGTPLADDDAPGRAVDTPSSTTGDCDPEADAMSPLATGPASPSKSDPPPASEPDPVSSSQPGPTPPSRTDAHSPSEAGSSPSSTPDAASPATPTSEPSSESDPTVAVLFRRRTHIDEYVAAFEAEGLTVADGSTHLFECPSVRAVVAVVDWLRAPTDPERLRTLVTESALALDALQAPLEARDWRFSAITTGPALPDREAAIVTRLQGLRDQRGIQAAQPPQTLVEEVVSHLALEQDPHDLLPDMTRTERQRTLDALRDWLAEWPAGDDTTPAEFASLVAPFVETPRKGPRQTRIGTADADVICTTIHQLKGDEADVVALADLGPELWQPGAPHQRLLTRGSTVALAPPELNTDHTDRLPIFEGGLYTPPGAGDSARSEGGLPRDVGLRWATERWQDASSDAPTRLIGHDHLQTVAAATRAEAWRVLYVALTRARDHLVVPLPRDLPGGVAPRDRWLETLRCGLQFDGTPRSGTYTCEPSTRAPGDRFVVGVNDVCPHTGATGQSDQTTSKAVPVATDAAVTPRYDPTEPSTPAPFVPRMLQPSTLAPLATAPDRYRLAYLQGASLHTAAEAIALDAPIAECGLGPAEIGTHVHDFLTTALARLEEMPTDDGTLETVLERALTEAGQAHWQAVTPAQRQALQQFVFDRLQPQLREAACWQRLLAADHVYTEQPVPGVVRLDGLAFEFDGTADVVCQCADDHWEVIELKIALAPLTDETRARYRVQAATYAYFLARQVDNTVRARVEVFGAERATIDAATAPPVTETLRQLVPDTTDSRGE